MAIHTVGACLELVEQRLEEARKTISVRLRILTVSSLANRRVDQLAFQVHSHVQGFKIGMVVNEVDMKVNEIHRHLLGTAAASRPTG